MSEFAQGGKVFPLGFAMSGKVAIFDKPPFLLTAINLGLATAEWVQANRCSR